MQYLIPSTPLNGTSVAQDTGQWAPRWKGLRSDLEHALSAAVSGRYVGRYQDYDSTKEIGDFWLFDCGATLNINRLSTGSLTAGQLVTFGQSQNSNRHAEFPLISAGRL